jgi:hypothetical protein
MIMKKEERARRQHVRIQPCFAIKKKKEDKELNASMFECGRGETEVIQLCPNEN